MTLNKTKIDSDEEFILKMNMGFGIILPFGLSLLLVSLLFIMTGALVTQITGEYFVPINLFTISLLLIGAIITTYYYYTHYVKRKLIINADGFILSIGNRSHEYKWSEFSLVALSVSFSTYGPKGYIIKLFRDDLQGDYVDLPIYRFSKSFDIYKLRSYIEEQVK